METQNLYREKMTAQLHEWSAQMSVLEARMDKATASMKLKSKADIASLRAQQHAAINKMHELGEASGAAWEQIKLSTDKMWDELKAGMSAAQAKFK